MKKLSCLFFIAAFMFLPVSCSREGRAPKAGVATPSFTLADLNGKKTALDEYKGKVVMLEFFASWCAPCQMFAPELQSVYRKYKDRGFVVLAVSIDEGKEAVPALKSFSKEFGVSYPILLDDGNTGKQFGVVSIPTSFILDKQGKIRSKHQGYIPEMSKQIEKEIEPLL